MNEYFDRLKKVIDNNDLNGFKGIFLEKEKEYYNEMGRNTIHILSLCNKLSYLKVINFDVNVKDKYNNNIPLHYSVRKGYYELSKYLLEKGSKYNWKDIDGYSALHFACLNRRIGIVKLLLKYENIDVNSVDKMNRTPLHRAVEVNDIEIVKVLLKKRKERLEMNIQDNNGQTPLHYASFNQNNEMCVLLSSNGCDSGIIDKNGKKALYWGYGFFSSPQNPNADYHYCGDPECNGKNCES